MNTPSPHPNDSMDLWGFLLGECAEHERQAIEAQLRVSPVLQRQLADCRAIVDALADPAMHDAPVMARNAARALFDQRLAKERQGFLSQVRLVLATIIHDSRSPEAMVGYRAGGGGDRHIIVHAEHREIDLRIEGHEPSRRLIGLITPIDAGEMIRVVAQGRSVSDPAAAITEIESKTNSDGVFMLNLPPGPIRVRFECDGTVIEIPEIR